MSSLPLSPQNSLFPIHSLYLLQFDVIKGYSCLYSNSFSNANKSHNTGNIEFKALPSGLHNFDQDTVFFSVVKEDDIFNANKIDFDNNLLYGIAVYKRFVIDNDITNRENIKMYSLVILVDPLNADSNYSSINSWKFKVFSNLWNFKTVLLQTFEKLVIDDRLIENFDVELDRVFDIYRFKKDRDVTFQKIIKNVNTKKRISIDNLNEFIQRKEQHSSPQIDQEQRSKSDHLLNNEETDKLNNEHMILYLFQIIKTLGPLLFKVYKLSLLRKKILIYSKDDNHAAIQNEDYLKLIYCISLISSIPLNLENYLIDSNLIHSNDLNHLKIHYPIFNLIINDLDFLKRIPSNKGFLSSTTDYLLLEKTDLFDYKLKISSTELPTLTNLSNSQVQYSTQKDLKKFNYLVNHFALNYLEDFNLDNENSFNKVTESISIKEYLWNGFNWWASAGSSSDLDNTSNDDTHADTLKTTNVSTYDSDDSAPRTPPTPTPTATSNANPNVQQQEQMITPVDDKIKDVLEIIGYFQSFTTRIFSMLVELINNDESAKHGQLSGEVEEDQVEEEEEEMREDGSEGSDGSDGTQGTNADDIHIESRDILEMGLDPYSVQDFEFLKELTWIYFKKNLRLGGYFGGLCCI